MQTISPAEAARRLDAGAVLIDVRESFEFAAGHAQGARNIPRPVLEADPSLLSTDAAAEILLICQSGSRSALAAEVLAAHGFARVFSIGGGTSAWADGGLPMHAPEDASGFHGRYARHLRLPEVGESGQRRLRAARVVMVGAGGLGSPAAFYLAAAGVGTLVLADDDVVERSNLQRQILHTEDRIGQLKVESAALALHALNPDTDVVAFAARVDSSNVDELLEGADVVIDGADNFAARYLVNDACVKLAKPLVYGAVHRFEGQVSVFDAGRHRGQAPCYRCLFPEPPAPDAAPNCSEAGVLGVLPGVIGVLQATEAIKLVLGLGESLAGRLLHFDALGLRFRETRLSADPDCPVCAPGLPFPGYIDYGAFCGGG